MKRSAYFDNLRIALTMLVILHHTAIAYGASGGWSYVVKDTMSGNTRVALSGILTINQAFFMSLYFFISAYFMPASFQRKGFSKYMADRFIRLGIPLVVYCTLVNPALNYAILMHTGHVNTGFGDYIVKSNRDHPNTAHLWFLLSLLLFESAYAVYRKFSHTSISKKSSYPQPSLPNLLLFALLCGVLAFLVRTVYPIGGRNFIGLQLGYFVLYIAMYKAGILAGRQKWFDQIPDRFANRIFAGTLLVALLIYGAWAEISRKPDLMPLYIGGLTTRSLILCCWEAIVCVGFCFSIPVLFRQFIHRQTPLSEKMAAGSYAAYVIHPIFVVGNTMLFESVAAWPFLKFAIVTVLSIAECFFAAHLIRQLPGLRRIF